ncbi:hypothetical protein NQ314_013891 [Rhamnusium bicolor]|uniref:Uncharacterized protein n=1 Tax=Rhamnusium bicolor TaxID=1586634 RepID=A0AAV8X5E5_9CUCU|nr:hypothetical protein NQ314_013891 [Rhamnusium bicolor]
MGKVFSMISNPFKNYNLESRAHKVISQAKPTPAPRHKTDEVDFERFMKDYPKAYKESLKKNEQLDKHLKDIYVKSHDATINVKQGQNPNRPLPSDRATVDDYLFCIPEETVKNILKFYRVFEVYIPQERQTKARFAGPSMPKVQIIKQLRKQLPPGSDKNDKT